MTSEKVCRKDKNQNIQVFVRLRPMKVLSEEQTIYPKSFIEGSHLLRKNLEHFVCQPSNQRERDIKSIGVVDVHNSKEIVVKFLQQTNITKKFTFDKAFGPNATQVEIYQEVVSPLIEEVLAGYNCTVFAYGQTGTGKTHTMVGEHTTDETCWQKDPMAGIIPRALSQLFDELRISNTEYTVRVSYLELYNEELFDLLSSSEDNSKLRIYEDVTRKGSNIVNGLEEITVYNKKEVYRIMAQGQERKRVASTLMNAQSSRSHTVFTIVIHMKENSPEGEELVKIGKLNLVDLAGSENISKAGSDNPAKKERARECVNINQSLLTLGRVITALVERHPHVPYRESKLTRILQESLGGRTKTSIIATISPGHKDLEETLSTLEYAHRAKNIQNKPEVNQKMTKKAILKEYAEEIDRLKRDLQAARDKNGVYLASDTFSEMTLKQEEQKKEIQELLLKKRVMEEERDKMEGVFSELNQILKSRDTELNATKNKLNSTKKQLCTTNDMLQSTRVQYEETQQLVRHHGATEQALTAQARELLATAETATQHVACLHDSVDKRRSLETSNLEVTRMYREQSSQQHAQIADGVKNFTETVTNELTELEAALESYIKISSRIQGENKQRLEGLVKSIIETMNETKSATSESLGQQTETTESQKSQLEGTLSSHQQELQDATAALLQHICTSLQAAEGVDVKGKVARFVEQWYEGASGRVWSVRRSQAEFEAQVRSSEAERTANIHARRECRRAHGLLIAENIQNSIARVELEKAEIEKRLSMKMDDIEAERRETETRLDEWVEEKRRLLEEELARHVAKEKIILESRLKRRMEEIQEERELLEERISKHIQLQQTQLEMNKAEMEMADSDIEESQNFRQQNEECVNKYAKVFDEGASAISTDMEVFSRNVVEVVEHVNNELLKTFFQAKDQIECEVKKLLETDEERCDRMRSAAGDALQTLLQLSAQLNQFTMHKLEMNNAATLQELNELASSTSTLITESQSHLAARSATVGGIRDEVYGLHSMLLEAVERHAELEGRYLSREYRLYSPTGKTPSRTEYRYPRTLAATSPHDRILARFRAMRQNSNDDECIVVQSDGETGCGSDCDSSLSEDSAVFAAPSPPYPPSLTVSVVPSHTAIVKSISETDIYAIRKRQDHRGKENPADSLTKKPSKLPSLSSHKKPLIERNGTVN